MRIARYSLCVAVIAAGLCGCGRRDGRQPAPPEPTRVERIDRLLSSSARFLAEHQAPDGAWRSDQYAPFRDGTALTPLVLAAMLPASASDDTAPAFQRGADYFASFVGPDGAIVEGPHGLNYPVYTAALAVVVLTEPGQARHRSARDAWLAYLRRQQLTEGLGWQELDKAYGGWGYSVHLPRKPQPGALTPPTEANLSATVFALEALRASGAPADDPAFRKALVFVQRRQNFAADLRERDVAFDDGGFTFIYDDGARNKAGPAGKDRTGRERFHSYGSTTADGLRALLACGRAPDDPRVVAARHWLETNFRADTQPGNYPPEREPLRSSVYYYYSLSVARALHALGSREVQTHDGKVRWAEALADELLKRQWEDGSWVNSAGAQREDDALVATSLAAAALAVCRSTLAAE